MPNPIISAMAVTAGTTWVTSVFQKRAAKLKAEHAHRESELEVAKSIYTEVSSTVDALRFYMVDEAIFVAMRKAKQRAASAKAKTAKADAAATEQDEGVVARDAANWAAYEKAVAVWKTSQNRLIAQTEVYFGKDLSALLSRIGEIFEEAGSKMEATYYGTPNSLIKLNSKGTGIVNNSGKFFGAVEPLHNNIRELNRVMMVLRTKEKVGSLRG